MIAAVLFLTFGALLLIGAPIAVCLGASSVITMVIQGLGKPIETVMSSLPMIVSASTSKFVLLAIPFFILAGNIMEKAGISEKLIRLAEACVGHRKGGIAIVCVIVSCFFAAISGSGPATVAALGVILVPAMIKSGYSPAFSAALMAASGAIGVVIPPSITFVVYGSIADTSIGDLFIAGLLPGILLGIAFAVTALLVGRKTKLTTLKRATGKEKWKAFKDAFWGLLMPVIILGGIYGGIFTPTAAASLFAYVLTRARLDVAISSALESATGGSTIVFFIIVNIILLIAGCFLDSTSALYIFTPLFVPVAKALGIDLIHLGVVMIVNLAIGLFTPPVGVNLYVACNVGKVDLKQISKAILPLLIAALIVLLIVTYIPEISLLLL